MNKKIIAIAIAAAMAAPVAMADLKISGRMAGHMVSSDKNGTGTAADEDKSDLSFGESGASRMQFDATSGNGYARIAYVVSGTAGFSATRDYYIGYKFGSTKAQFGRMGHAGKNIEKDALVTTFLEIRKTNAEAATSNAYGSSGFTNDVIQVAGKVGGAKYKVQFGPQTNSNRGSTGKIAVGLSGKAGPVGYFVSYNNGAGSKDTSDNTIKTTNTKGGFNMKFGSAKVTLVNQQADNEGVKEDATAILAEIGMGKGLAVHVGASSGKKDGVKNTFSRLAVTKKMNKGFMVYGGVTSSNADDAEAVTQTGVGVIMKF